jgi:hypothetical protein
MIESLVTSNQLKKLFWRMATNTLAYLPGAVFDIKNKHFCGPNFLTLL